MERNPDNGRHRPRLLVVDDCKPLREALAAFLDSAGYNVDVVADGYAALDAARSTNYGVIILDVHMNKLDGPAVARQLRQSGPNPRIPLVGISVDDAAHVRERCIKAGMDAFFCKDENLDILLDIIHSLLHNHGAAAESSNRTGRHAMLYPSV